MFIEQEKLRGLGDTTSDGEEEAQNPNPLFWLEMRTFDDGLMTARTTAAAMTTPSTTTTTTAAADLPARDGCSFPQFRLLPPELRCKIWACLVQPRIVVASCLKRDETLDRRRAELRSRTSPGAAVPVLLQVNRESRALGLQHYELAFGWRISKLLSDTPVSLPVSRPPRVYFNFALDALLLTGELEPFDSYGFNSTAVYFLRRADTRRVRHVACAFRELGYPQLESDEIFTHLWHVVDMFPRADRLLLTVADGDEDLIGAQSLMLSPNNVMQKIWNGWMAGTTVTTSKMADKQIVLVREDGLADFIASQPI